MKIVHHTARISSALVFICALAFTPFLGWADNGNNASKKSVSCIQAYNYFVSQGWVKANKEQNITADCRFPFKDFQNWYNKNRGKVSDTTAPVVANITVTPKTTSAVLKWTTNENTRSAVFYATVAPVVVRTGNTNGKNISTSVTSSNSQVKIDNDLRKTHSITLNNLSVGTTYLVVIASRDTAGNLTISDVRSLTTTPSGDTAAPAISDLGALVSTDGIKLTWKTNEQARIRVLYSTAAIDVNNTSTFTVLSDTTLRTNHSATLPVITRGVTYHFVIESKDSIGNTSVSSEYLISSL